MTSRWGFAIALLIAATLGHVAPVAGQSSPVTIAIDVDTGGNTARSVASVDDCVPATAGQPLTIDIALPAPGIPSDRGVAGFQFNLFFDSLFLSVVGEDTKLLLAQAPGSNVFAISGPLPNDNGDHFSAALDFARRGVEPAGAGEIGPGVLSRLTLLPKANGRSDLVIRDVIVKDPEGNDFTLAAIERASVSVGAPCPTPAPTPTPAPQASATPSPKPTAIATPSSVFNFALGGRPPGDGAGIASLLLGGSSAAVIGGALIVVAMRARRR